MTPKPTAIKIKLADINGHLATFHSETSFILPVSEKCRRSASGTACLSSTRGAEKKSFPNAHLCDLQPCRAWQQGAALPPFLERAVPAVRPQGHHRARRRPAARPGRGGHRLRHRGGSRRRRHGERGPERHWR